WASAQILFADSPCANDISVGHEATPRTAEPAATWFVSPSARRACPRRIVLVLEHNAHPTALRLVREHVANHATGHLVTSLVLRVPVLDVLASITAAST